MNRDHEELTGFDYAIIIGICGFCLAFVWWAYRASVLWETLQ